MDKLQVFYDESCPLCAREVAHYRKQNGANSIDFVDISSSNFRAQDFGIDSDAVHRLLHVKTPDGRIKVGVDAFSEIWHVLPRYRWLLKVLEIPGARPLAELGYSIFAKLRPYLPKRKSSCEVGCHTGERRPR